MNQFYKYIFIFTVVITTIFSCTIKPDFPNEPIIKFISLDDNVANQGAQIWVNLTFTDGDGNLGQVDVAESTCGKSPIYLCEYDTDSSCYKDPFWSSFLIDVEDSCFGVPGHLPSFEPDGNVKAVSGELRILTNPLFCKNNGNSNIDTVVFKVIVRDASGNYSNKVLTDTIYVNCN
ncbi:MAG: hypothetical protein ACI8ZX_000161 [Planctomycetota bacterium]|jgi:hypothetical protein